MTCDDIRKATTLVEQEDDILVHQLTRLEAALAHTTAEADEARVVEFGTRKALAGAAGGGPRGW